MSTNDKPDKVEPQTVVANDDDNENIFALFGTDKKAEDEGVIIDYGKAGWFRVRPAAIVNKPYIRAIEKYNRKNGRRVQAGMITEDQARKDIIPIFVDTVIIDGELKWKDGTMRSMKNRAHAIEVLMALPLLFNDVREQSQNMELFRQIDREEEAKN